jgi:hypothetical protein
VARLYAENYARLAKELQCATAEAAFTPRQDRRYGSLHRQFSDREWDLARFLLLEQHVRLKSYAERPLPSISSATCSPRGYTAAR